MAKYTLRDYQQAASDAAVRYLQTKPDGHNSLLILPTGCHAKGYGILMYDGTLKRVEDITVGDMVMGVDSTPRTVLALHHGEDDMYEIAPIKGEPLIVNAGHVLSLHKTNEGKDYPSCLSRVDEISVSEYISTSKNYKHLHKMRRVGAVEFPTKERPQLPPYLIGLMLGDGSIGIGNGGVNITTMREEVRDYIYQFAQDSGYSVRDDWKGAGNKAHSYHIRCGRSGKRWYTKSRMRLELESLGLWSHTAGDKFIPPSYKTAARAERMELLAGLLDTDAYYDVNKNSFEYCTKSETLADDVVFICRSLGYFCSKKEKVVNGTSYYRLNVTGDLDEIPTRVSIRKGRARRQKKSHLVTGFGIRYAGRGEYYGFTLDGDHLYIDEQFFVHHNSGKSLVVADIASRLNEPLLVLQPSIEILQQNAAKYESYGFKAGVFSASAGRKDVRGVTFATIGSVMNKVEDFAIFSKVLVDECHLVNPKGGQYEEFLEGRRTVGLTATPYRLAQSVDPATLNDTFPEYGSTLKFLTRTRPRVFDSVLYYCQVQTLLDRGYLARLRYFDLTRIDLSNVEVNSTGADYREKSLFEEFERVGMYEYTLSVICRVLRPKNGVPRNGILVFVRFVDDARRIADAIIGCEMVSGETPKRERAAILERFKSGETKVVVNVGVLTTGFDHPALDTIILARPTMSLALYYQMCLDMNTEILTKRGFLSYEETRSDDLVAAYEDGAIRFVPIQEKIHRKTYDGEKFVTFTNQHLDFRVTGEHELLVKARLARHYKKEEALDILKRKGMSAVPVSGVETAEGAGLTDDEVRFVAWCVSDGSVSKLNNAVCISQSLKNARYVDEIRRVLASCGLRFTECLHRRKGAESVYADCVHFLVSHGDPRKVEDRRKGLTGWSRYEEYISGCKRWSEAFERLDEHQFDVFIDTICQADGSHRKTLDYDEGSLTVSCGIYKEYAGRLQSLAVRRGYRANLYTYTNANGNDAFTLHLKKQGHSTIPGCNVSDGTIDGKKPYRRSRPTVETGCCEDVWCVRNEVGTIVTRRNGKVLVMGNCGRAIRPFAGKEGWVIDLCGSIAKFGKVEDLWIDPGCHGKWVVVNKATGEQLTNVLFKK